MKQKMKMKMTYEELINNPEYEKLDEFSHNEIKQIIMREIGEGGSWANTSNLYQVLSLIAVILAAFKVFVPFLKHGIYQPLIAFAGGILFSVTFLIAFHEIIHALAYKYVGAKKLYMGMRLRKFLFFVQADKQVLDFHKFKIVALAPFITVIVLTIIGMVFSYGHPMFYFFLSIFSIHSLFCGGDFGLLSYFENREDRKILTFDMVKEQKTYFYVKKEME